MKVAAADLASMIEPDEIVNSEGGMDKLVVAPAAASQNRRSLLWQKGSHRNQALEGLRRS